MVRCIRHALAAVFAVSLVFGLATPIVTTVAAASGVTYYVQAGGNDGANGLASGTAWRTVGRVNRALLHPGDQVRFNGGDTFPGLLYFAPGSGGAANDPITLSSYGTGRATVSGGAGGAFFAYDAAGIEIDNLAFAGSGANANTSDGISFFNDLSGGVKLSHIRISRVDVSGFGKSGISIGGWNGSSGFTDARITFSSIHDNRKNGLLSFGPTFIAATPIYANNNFYIGHVSAYHNLGDPSNLWGNSGNGIVLGSVQSGTVERSSAWGNGSLCPASQCGAGIWTYDSTAIVIQSNESYSNHSASRLDGDGFDLDQNVSNSYLQYNYSHNNDGAGFLDYSGLINSAHANNTVRYNVSENDARTNDGSVTISGHVYKDAIYNNTVFLSAQLGATPVALKVIGAPSGVTVRNNIFEAAAGLPIVSSEALGISSVLLQQNDYSSTPLVIWGLSSFTALDTWRVRTGQELLGIGPTGLAVDPGLASAGNGGTLGNPDLLTSLSAYHLVPSSSMIGAALNLKVLFGVDMGGHDFYGVALPTGSALNLSAGD